MCMPPSCVMAIIGKQRRLVCGASTHARVLNASTRPPVARSIPVAMQLKSEAAPTDVQEAWASVLATMRISGTATNASMRHTREASFVAAALPPHHTHRTMDCRR